MTSSPQGHREEHRSLCGCVHTCPSKLPRTPPWAWLCACPTAMRLEQTERAGQQPPRAAGSLCSGTERLSRNLVESAQCDSDPRPSTPTTTTTTRSVSELGVHTPSRIPHHGRCWQVAGSPSSPSLGVGGWRGVSLCTVRATVLGTRPLTGDQGHGSRFPRGTASPAGVLQARRV